MRRNVTYCVATLTSDDVNKIAKEANVIPENFDPESWLEENLESITTLAVAAVRDLVIEAFEVGLGDHPLVLLGQRRAAAKTVH